MDLEPAGADTPESGQQCPRGPGVVTRAYEPAALVPATEHWAELDSFRDEHDFLWADKGPGFWVFLKPEAIRDGYHDHETFSSRSVNLLVPDAKTKFLPLNYDPPEHTKFRRLLSKWFSPKAARRQEPDLRQFAQRRVAELAGEGRCEFITAYAGAIPTVGFIRSVGLPVSDGETLYSWVSEYFHDTRGPKPHEAIATYLERIRGYFEPLIRDRRSNPKDPEEDFLTFYLNHTIDDRPITDAEALNTCEVFMLGGLDTTKSMLGYVFHHLATNPNLRRTLVTTPDLIPMAIEEFLRIYPIASGPGRYVTRDVDFHGCPMKRGDMVKFVLSAENRDPAYYEKPTEIVLDRYVTRHNTFGLGPHRCVGSHLARMELLVALEEWHRLIPDYELDADEPLMEGATELGLIELPLRWQPT